VDREGDNMAYENQRIQDAYEAGCDCHRNGPNLVNTHYTWFATPEMKEAWERGKLDGGCHEEAN
jgi:hypothetical protein